jgi:hypothetical protein
VVLYNAELCYRRCNREDITALRSNPKTRRVKTVLFGVLVMWDSCKIAGSSYCDGLQTDMGKIHHFIKKTRIFSF